MLEISTFFHLQEQRMKMINEMTLVEKAFNNFSLQQFRLKGNIQVYQWIEGGRILLRCHFV